MRQNQINNLCDVNMATYWITSIHTIRSTFVRGNNVRYWHWSLLSFCVKLFSWPSCVLFGFCKIFVLRFWHCRALVLCYLGLYVSKLSRLHCRPKTSDFWQKGYRMIVLLLVLTLFICDWISWLTINIVVQIIIIDNICFERSSSTWTVSHSEQYLIARLIKALITLVW